MKNIFLLASLLIFVACKTENNKALQSESEDFTTFFNKFKSDSLFQKERCVENISFYGYDDENEVVVSELNKEALNFLDFAKDSMAHQLEFDAYKVEISQTKDSVDYHLWGIENGINVSFVFKKKENNWFLFSIYDLSN